MLLLNNAYRLSGRRSCVWRYSRLPTVYKFVHERSGHQYAYQNSTGISNFLRARTETFTQNLRMFQILTYLLACSMGLPHVMGLNAIVLPDVVKGRGLQCQDRGAYEGACTSQNVANELGSGFGCENLICGKKVPGPVIEYEAVSTGPPVDGSQCAKYHVCIKGKCLFAGSRNVPTQQGPGPSVRCLQSVIQRSPPPSTTRKTVIVTPRPKQSGNTKNDRNR